MWNVLDQYRVNSYFPQPRQGLFFFPVVFLDHICADMAMLSFLMYGVPLLAVVGIVVFFALRRKRSDAKREKKEMERTPERLKKEQDLLLRLEKLKRKTDHVASAVDKDPVRAAKVVRTMMKDKTKLRP